MPSGSPATSWATTRSAASSATTSCADRHSPRRRVSSRRGRTAPGPCSTGSPIPSGSASPSSDAARPGHRLRGEAGPAQERPHPDRRVLPAARRIRASSTRLAPSGRGRVRDHRRAQPLHPRRPPLQPGSTRATGPTPGPSRPCSGRPSWPATSTMPARLAAAGQAGRSADGRGRRTDVDATATRGFRRRSSPAAPASSARAYVRDVLARRDGTRITVLDKLTYAGNEANLAAVRADPEQAARLRFVRGDIADPAARAPARRRGRRGRQLRRRIARRPLHPRPRGVPGHGRDRGPRPARGLPHRRASAALPAGLDRRGLRLGRGGPRRARCAARPALAVRGGQGGRRAARPELRRDPRRRCGRDPRLQHLRPVSTIPRSSSRCSSPTPSTTGRCRCTATACSAATGCTWPTTRRRSTTSCAMAPRARRTTCPAGPSRRTATCRGAPARPPRQAVVAGPPGRGSARPRPALRDGRDEAGRRSAGSHGRRSRTAWPRRSTGSGPTRPGGVRRGPATGTASTSASTAPGSRSRPPQRPSGRPAAAVDSAAPAVDPAR